MNKQERRQLAEKLKKDYKDFEQYVDKKDQDWIKFNLGEISVPKGLEEQRLKVIPHEGKNYLIFTLNIGMNDKLKQERKQERQKLAIENRKKRIGITVELKETKLLLKEAIKSNDDKAVEKYKAKVGELSAELEATKLR